MARDAGIGMPEVGIFPAYESNAFATGWNRNNSLVAVSQGLLERFSREEVEAVLAHEIGHIANGDMVTMTLIQGVVNTFVMFFARIFGSFVDKAIFKTKTVPALVTLSPLSLPNWYWASWPALLLCGSHVSENTAQTRLAHA